MLMSYEDWAEQHEHDLLHPGKVCSNCPLERNHVRNLAPRYRTLPAIGPVRFKSHAARDGFIIAAVLLLLTVVVLIFG